MERHGATTSANVIIRHTPVIQNVAFAARELPRGTVVLQEEPMLLVTKARPTNEGPEVDALFDALEVIAVKHGYAPNYLNCVHAFLKASPDVRQRVADAFWSDMPEDDPVVSRVTSMCADVAAVPALAASEYTESTWVSLVLTMRTKQHAAGEDLSAWGLYDIGGRVPHACDPNLVCMMEGTRVKFRAIRPICAGEMLTFSYISAVDLWLPTPYRRRKLREARFFHCCCIRCVGPDTCRMMKCPNCGSSSVTHFLRGQLMMDGRRDEGHVTDSPWRCPKCEKRWRDVDLPLEQEEKLVQAVELLNYTQDECRNKEDVMQLLVCCRDNLGNHHSATAKTAYILVCMHHTALTSQGTPFPAQQVLEWIQYLHYWLSTCLSGSLTESSVTLFCGRIAELHNAFLTAALCYRSCLPLQMQLLGAGHPTVSAMRRVVKEHNVGNAEITYAAKAEEGGSA